MAGRLLVSLFLCAMLAGCGQSERTPEPVVADGGDDLYGLMQDWIFTTSDGADAPGLMASPIPQPTSVAPVGDLLSGLEARLEENPDDVGGWRLLAQSYAHVGRWEDAEVAADRAIELGADAEQLRAAMLTAHTSTAN